VLTSSSIFTEKMDFVLKKLYMDGYPHMSIFQQVVEHPQIPCIEQDIMLKPSKDHCRSENVQF